ncbi:MAG: hypothetical protein AAF533_05485 [Acidobacteriota bacterium]
MTVAHALRCQIWLCALLLAGGAVAQDEDCVDCDPCDLFQLVNELVPPAEIPADHPCFDAPPIEDPTACCPHFLALVSTLPGPPRIPSTHPCGGCGQPCTSYDFEGVAAGDVITTQFAGMTVSGTRPIRAFDSGSPTCGDLDLSTPGPGFNNALARGIILVLEETSSCQPNDAQDGGIIVMTFDEPREIQRVGLLDVDEPGGRVRAFDERGNLLIELPAVLLPDNSWQELILDVCDVKRLEVALGGSGALTDVTCVE